MYSYLIETEKDLKELFCGLSLKNLVEFQQSIKSILEIKDNDVVNLDVDYFLSKKLKLEKEEK
jgi:hypothetical protein